MRKPSFSRFALGQGAEPFQRLRPSVVEEVATVHAPILALATTCPPRACLGMALSWDGDSWEQYGSFQIDGSSSVTDEVGKLGHVVTRIRGGEKPGEVTIPIRGGHEVYLAYSESPIERSVPILVVSSRGGRCLDVVPWTDVLN